MGRRAAFLKAAVEARGPSLSGRKNGTEPAPPQSRDLSALALLILGREFNEDVSAFPFP